MNKRLSWDEYFMKIAEMTAKRSSCNRVDRSMGAVIVKEKRIIATGYNGAPANIETCINKEKCMRKDQKIKSGTNLHLCYAIHAEENAILQCAKLGTSCDGAVIYTTHFPCPHCMREIMQVGIKKIVYKESYPASFSEKLLDEYQGEILLKRMADEKDEETIK